MITAIGVSLGLLWRVLLGVRLGGTERGLGALARLDYVILHERQRVADPPPRNAVEALLENELPDPKAARAQASGDGVSIARTVEQRVERGRRSLL